MTLQSAFLFGGGLFDSFDDHFARSVHHFLAVIRRQNPRVTISGADSMRPVCLSMAMMGTTTPSSARCRRSRITTSSISSSEPESTQHASRRHRFAPERPGRGELDRLAILQQDTSPETTPICCASAACRKSCRYSPCKRNKIFRPHQVDQQLLFFLARVAGNVNRRRHCRRNRPAPAAGTCDRASGIWISRCRE